MDILVIQSTKHSSEHLIEVLAAHEWDIDTIDIITPICKLEAVRHAIVILHSHVVDAELVRHVRAEAGKVPLIVVLPTCAARHLAAVLQAGADDAISYPFEPLELVERVRALARRAGWQRQTSPTIERLVIDRDSRRVHVNGQSVSLTSLEFDLLCYLDARRSSTVTADEIAFHVHGTSHRDGGVVRQLVHKLRKKLGNGVSIITRRGKGYALVRSLVRSDPNDSPDESHGAAER